MLTESNTPAAGSAGVSADLQARIGALAELLAKYRCDPIEDVSPLAQLLADLRGLADAQQLDFYDAVDTSYLVYLAAKTPA